MTVKKINIRLSQSDIDKLEAIKEVMEVCKVVEVELSLSDAIRFAVRRTYEMFCEAKKKGVHNGSV